MYRPYIDLVLSGSTNLKNIVMAPHFIGESYGGGIVFYTWSGGTHGLIAGVTGSGVTSAPWRWIYGAYGTSTEIGAGLNNTNIIIAFNSGQPAFFTMAKYCGDLTLGGYSDWFMPSKDELYQIGLQRVLLGLGDDPYNSSFWWSFWSSSESDLNHAWYISNSSNKPTGTPLEAVKWVYQTTIPIRQF
jgi:hypothetical protein